MARKFRQPNYEATLQKTIKLEEVLPATHLSRYIVSVISQLDLSEFYARYAESGGMPYAPEMLLGLLCYGYATGIFSSRKIEKATYESIPFRYIAGDMHPDHDTINTFRLTFLNELKVIFVDLLLVAHLAGKLELGNISIDGTKVHADASKSQAVSYKRLQELQAQFKQEVEELFVLAEQAEPGAGSAPLDIAAEIERRQAALAQLAEARRVIEERAQERYTAELAEYEAKLAERKAKEEQSGHKTRGVVPQPPSSGAGDKEQYNFTDPDSRIMKNGNNAAFEQSYNGQVAVDQASRLIVANTLSNHPNDKQEALPTVQAIAPALGTPASASLDNGYFSAANVKALLDLGIEPYIAPGREAHHPGWQAFLHQPTPPPPPADASLKVQMAYKLHCAVGNAIYRLRKSTVEPVIGIIKETIGFRQFSLRGLDKVAGEWNLVCLAYNFKRLHLLQHA
jgi:transposase